MTNQQDSQLKPNTWYWGVHPHEGDIFTPIYSREDLMLVSGDKVYSYDDLSSLHFFEAEMPYMGANPEPSPIRPEQSISAELERFLGYCDGHSKSEGLSHLWTHEMRALIPAFLKTDQSPPDMVYKQEIARIIQTEVSYFNGWKVDDDVELEACEKAAERSMAFIKPQPTPNNVIEQYEIISHAAQWLLDNPNPELNPNEYDGWNAAAKKLLNQSYTRTMPVLDNVADCTHKGDVIEQVREWIENNYVCTDMAGGAAMVDKYRLNDFLLSLPSPQDPIQDRWISVKDYKFNKGDQVVIEYTGNRRAYGEVDDFPCKCVRNTRINDFIHWESIDRIYLLAEIQGGDCE